MGCTGTISSETVIQPISKTKKDQILSKFSEPELKMLYYLFNDLCINRNKKNFTVSKIAFQKFTHLPGLIGERLYAYFNPKYDEKGVQYEQFITCIGKFVCLIILAKNFIIKLLIYVWM